MSNEIIQYKREQMIQLGKSGIYLSPDQLINNIGNYLETTTQEQMQQDFETFVRVIIGTAVFVGSIYALSKATKT